ncbi:hypothetical protein ACWGS9_34075 [Bradyrhizobium sp. Arg314]
MAKQEEPTERQRAILAAVRRFQQFELAIHRLVVRSESFLEICEELADAELALSSVDKTTTAALVEARRAEWQELVDRLVGEVEAALQDLEASRMTLPRKYPNFLILAAYGHTAASANIEAS